MIARIRGYCLGVGLELALACDFRVAADDVQLGLPEVGLGMIPGSGGTQRLARLVGLGRAKDVVMRRRRIARRRRAAWGLVSEVVPAAELDAAVERVIADLDALSPLALRIAKRVLNHVYDAPLSIGLELEGLAYGLLRSTRRLPRGRRGVRREARRRSSKAGELSISAVAVRRTDDTTTKEDDHAVHVPDLRRRAALPGHVRRRAQRRCSASTAPSPSRSRTSGNFVAGDALQPTSTATTVRVRDGETLVTDGPFAETKEQLGGYYLIEAKDADEALAIAARIPSAQLRLDRGAARWSSARSSVEPVAEAFREEFGRAVSILIRALGDFDLAEDAVQEAFAIAAERWPRDGVPANPGAWIVTTARNRAIDRLRREREADRALELARLAELVPETRRTTT